MQIRCIVCTASALWMLACGTPATTDDVDAPAFDASGPDANWSGEGSGTLQVIAESEIVFSNGGLPSHEISVRVYTAGEAQAVPDAAVWLVAQGQRFDVPSLGAGYYMADFQHEPTVVELNVERGSDFLRNARVAPPRARIVSLPAAPQLDQPLEVTWSPVFGEAPIYVGVYAPDGTFYFDNSVVDDGSFTVPAWAFGSPGAYIGDVAWDSFTQPLVGLESSWRIAGRFYFLDGTVL